MKLIIIHLFRLGQVIPILYLYILRPGGLTSSKTEVVFSFIVFIYLFYTGIVYLRKQWKYKTLITFTLLFIITSIS